MTSKAFDNATDANRQQGGRRNLIINGAMQVAQRGTSFTSGAAIYTLDRWKSQARAGASVTTTKEADQLVDGKSFGVLQHNVTTAASDGLTLLNQYIENGSQDLYGQQVTLSWYARVTSGSATIQPVYEMNSETSDTGDTETLTSDWQKFTYTTTLTGYTYPATTYEHLRLAFYIRDNSAHTVQITGVQLEVGTVATPFEHRSYGEELALCQRYYIKFIDDDSNAVFAVGQAYDSSTVNAPFQFPTEMRASPTGTINDDWRIRNSTGSSGVLENPTINTAKKYAHIGAQRQNGGLVAGNAAQVWSQAGSLELDAEL